MYVLRDSASIQGAVTALPAVASFIARRLEDLAEYDDYELSELLNIVVVEPQDSLDQVSAALGFDAADRTAEVIEAHPGWYELTYLLGDDGFGVVLYVPNTPDIDPRLRELCSSQTARRASR
jgi:hypothetical protein